MKSLLACSLFILALPASASAHLYKSVSSSGKVMYADRPSDEQYANVSVMRAAGLEMVESAKSGGGDSAARSVRGGAAIAAPVVLSSAPRMDGDKLERIDIEIKSDGRAIAAKSVALPHGQTAAGIKTSR